MAVIGPVGRSTSSGCVPKSACAAPATEFIRRYSDSPMRWLVCRATSAPSATVLKNVAKNMKSAADRHLDQRWAAVA
eukprot:175532-Prymnesium_polylepis.1